YSAVTQPRPLPRRKPGTFSSTLAVHSTRVSPKLTRTEPSACRVKRRWRLTARIWSGARPLGRVTVDMGGSGKSRPARLPFAPADTGTAHDPQHDRLRRPRARRHRRHAGLRASGGEPPLPRAGRAPARGAARDRAGRARAGGAEGAARQAGPGAALP